LQAVAGRRLGGRRAPLQVAATTKTKITQARKASTSGNPTRAADVNLHIRSGADAVEALKLVQPIVDKAKKVIANEVKGAALWSASTRTAWCLTWNQRVHAMVTAVRLFVRVQCIAVLQPTRRRRRPLALGPAADE